MLDWLRDHAWELALTSGAMLVAGLLLTPLLVSRMPADYFVRTRKAASANPVLWLVRNVIGLLLVGAGILMLILPGQGILTILLGLSVAVFPGKRRLELWIVRRPSVLRAIQWLRSRSGRAPLRIP